MGTGASCPNYLIEKDVYERYLLSTNLETLIGSEDIAAKRPRWVYYIHLCMEYDIIWAWASGLLILYQGSSRAS